MLCLQGAQDGSSVATHGSPWQVGVPAGLGASAPVPRAGRPNSALGWQCPRPCPYPDPALRAPSGRNQMAPRLLFHNLCLQRASPAPKPPGQPAPTVWSPNTSSDFQRSFTDYKLRSDTLALRVTIPQRKAALARIMEEGTEVRSCPGTSLCERGGSHSLN